MPCRAFGELAGGWKGQAAAGTQEMMFAEAADLLLCVILFKVSPLKAEHIYTCNRNLADWQ